jgi:hypothetical protein
MEAHQNPYPAAPRSISYVILTRSFSFAAGATLISSSDILRRHLIQQALQCPKITTTNKNSPNNNTNSKAPREVAMDPTLSKDCGIPSFSVLVHP